MSMQRRPHYLRLSLCTHMPLPKPRGRKSPYRLHFRYRTYRWWRLPRALSRLSPRAAIARRYIHLVQLPCAKCGQRMEATLLQGIEIEVCPDCGGIYLDAGELQKIMDEKKWGPISGALSYARKVWGEL